MTSGALTSTTFLMAAEVTLLLLWNWLLASGSSSWGAPGVDGGRVGVVGGPVEGPPDHTPHNNTRKKNPETTTTTACKTSLDPTLLSLLTPPPLTPHLSHHHHHHLSIASITAPFALIHLLSLPNCYCFCSQPWQAGIHKWFSAC